MQIPSSCCVNSFQILAHKSWPCINFIIDAGFLLASQITSDWFFVITGNSPTRARPNLIADAQSWNCKSRKAYGICMSLYDQHPINGKISGEKKGPFCGSGGHVCCVYVWCLVIDWCCMKASDDVINILGQGAVGMSIFTWLSYDRHWTWHHNIYMTLCYSSCLCGTVFTIDTEPL